MNRLRYLSGIDWVITGLEQSLRQTAGVGNWSQLVFELEGKLDDDLFRETAQRYVESFPVLQGRVGRAWHGVPFWKTPKTMRVIPVPIESDRLSDEASLEDLTHRLGQCLIAPPGEPGSMVGFMLLYTRKTTFLAFRFDHRLLDARGAELFFKGLVDELKDPKTLSQNEPCEIPFQKANLRPWIPKFKSGQQVVRLLRRQQEAAAPFQLSAHAERSGVPSPETRTSTSASPFHFKLLSLTPSESESLIARAYDEAGYLMLTPWLAAKMTDVLDHLIKKTDQIQLKGQVIPCAIDLRDDKNKEMFFNRVSFLYLCRSKGEACPRDLPKQFSRQFFGQIQQGMPQHLENAWKLARIIPAPLYGKLLKGPLKNFAGTFNLAYVGEGLSDIQTLAEHSVRNAFHMPLVPPAPGLGFFINRFQGGFNLCITSTRDLLSDEDMDELLRGVKQMIILPS